MKRTLVVLAVLLVATWVHARPAGADFGHGWQDFGAGWYEDNYGVVQCATKANQLRCDKITPWGQRYYGVVDFWWPGFCQPIVVNPGSNAQGRPFSFVMAAPGWHPGGCFPNGFSQFHGFHDGLGTYEGQNHAWDFFTAEQVIPIFPRNPGTLNGQGTIVYVGWNI